MKLRLFIATVSLVAAASSAHAQRRDAIVEGAGYEIGEGTVFHPRASLSTGVISNVLYQAEDSAVAPVLRVLASFAIASEHNKPRGLTEPAADSTEAGSLVEGADDPAPSPSLDYRVGGRIEYTQYLSGDSLVSQQNGLDSLGVGFDVHAVALPRGSFSATFDDSFTRSVTTLDFDLPGSINRDINQLQAGLRFRPGAGALQFLLAYENTLDVFESDTYANSNRMNHLLRGRAEWQFLPITRFFLDTSLGFFGHFGSTPAMATGEPKPSSTPLRIQLGAASAITENTTVRAHVGFGKGFYANRAMLPDAEFTGAIFGAEFGLRYSPTGRFTVAYQYDFKDSVQANFYRDHTVAARVDQQIERILIGVKGEARIRGYRGVLPSIRGGGGATNRDDLIFRLESTVHYLYRDWLAFVGEVNAISDRTDYRDASGDDPSFNRFEVFAGATAAF